MGNVLREAKELLAAIEERLPYKLNEVPQADNTEILGTLRGKDGYPILRPHPESMSILVGEKPVFAFLLRGPEVLRGLIELIEANDTGKSLKSQNSGDSTQNSS